MDGSDLRRKQSRQRRKENLKPTIEAQYRGVKRAGVDILQDVDEAKREFPISKAAEDD
jgi:hypothetical protein